ncbi:hypothetical protein K151_174 [Proteus hauseri ZMd44]|nr:hypothetical protein K151_174 [Proteus hauseri ZMd44]
MLSEHNLSPTIIVKKRTVAQITVMPNKVIFVNFIDSFRKRRQNQVASFESVPGFYENKIRGFSLFGACKMLEPK